MLGLQRGWIRASKAIYDPPWLCLSCQQKLGAQHRLASSRRPKDRERLPIEPTPKLYRKDENKPLHHKLTPVGQADPPKSGDNPHFDTRPWSEKWSDYLDPHEARRQWMKPAFLSWAQLYFHKGKTFLATPRPFRSDISLYFPNMQGYTLADPRNIYDTTSILRGKISIVRLSSEQWAQSQCESFTDDIQNPLLVEETERLKDKGVQMVNINIEEQWSKAILVRLSVRWHRKEVPKEEWPNTFMVRKGINDYTRRDLGVPNPRVGHVYVVDQNCKIRWAGCGNANDEERDSLVMAVRRLAEPSRFVAQEELESNKSVAKKPLRMALNR